MMAVMYDLMMFLVWGLGCLALGTLFCACFVFVVYMTKEIFNNGKKH